MTDETTAPAAAPETAADAFAPVEAAIKAAETQIDSAASASPSPAAVESLVETWFTEQVQNSAASRDTVIYNHLRSAVDILKTRLAAL